MRTAVSPHVLNNGLADPIVRRRAQRGSTAIEFAFVIIPLVWMVGYLIETGLFLTVQYELQNAVIDASRQIRTGPPPTQDAFKTAVCRRVVLIRNCASSIRIDVRSQSGGTFTGLKAVMRDPMAVGPATTGGTYTEVYQPGSANDPGAVIVTYDWPFVVPFIGAAFANLSTNRTVRRLYGVAVYKNENYS